MVKSSIKKTRRDNIELFIMKTATSAYFDKILEYVYVQNCNNAGYIYSAFIINLYVNFNVYKTYHD